MVRARAWYGSHSKIILFKGNSIPARHFKEKPTAGLGSSDNRLTRIEISDGGNGITIGEYAFLCCEFLKYASISGLKTLPARLFAGCKALEAVAFGEGLTSISEVSSFIGCPKLKTVKIPGTLREIDSLAFFGCSVQLIIICTSTFFDYFRVRMLLSEADRMKAFYQPRVKQLLNEALSLDDGRCAGQIFESISPSP